MLRRGAAILFLIALPAGLGLVPARGQPAAAVAGPAVTRPIEPDARRPDPFPIRRTFVPGNRLAATIAAAPGGVLRRLPAGEFESLVQAAALGSLTEADPPRIAEARYRAKFSEHGLIGTGEWTLVYPERRPGRVRLDALDVAVNDVKWPDGRPAVLSGLALWPDSLADRSTSFSWSARGNEEPSAERFVLVLPQTAIASLELDLPADRLLTAPTPGSLLVGPFPLSDGGRRGWRLSFGGLSRVELAVRRPGSGGEPSPAVRGSRSMRFDLEPIAVPCSFDFDLEAIRGPFSEVRFKPDPGVVVTGATATSPITWLLEGGEVRVTFREPTPNARVTLSATVPLGARPPATWACPQVKLVGGVPGSDSIDIRVDPDLKFLGLEPGDYAISSTAVGEDRRQRISLAGTLSQGSERRLPIVRLRTVDAEFSTTEDVAWSVGPAGNSLTANVTVKVLRGPLSQIAVQIPSGYSVESSVLTPDDAAATSSPGPNNTWVIEPSRPFATGQTPKLRVEFRGPANASAGDPAGGSTARQPVPFPRFEPIGAVDRDGTLRVSSEPGIRTWTVPPLPTAGLTYRDREPEGWLYVGPPVPRATASSDTALSLDAGQVVARTRIRISGDDGSFSAATIFLPDSTGAKWTVTVDAPTTANPVPGGAFVPWLGTFAGSGWSAALGTPAAGAARGQLWRIAFSRPLRGDAIVSVVGRWPASRSGPFELPVPTVLGAVPLGTTVTLDASAAARFEPPGRRVDPSIPGFVRVGERGAAPAPSEPGGSTWRFANVALDTRVLATGELAVEFRGDILESTGPVLTLGLPSGARLQSLEIDDRSAEPLSHAASEVSVRIPTVGSGGLPFAVRYLLPAPSWGVVETLTSPTPELPGPSGPVVRRWAFAGNFQKLPRLDSSSEFAVEGSETVRVIRSRYAAAVGGALAALLAALGLGAGTRGSRRGAAVLAAGVAAFGIAGWLAPTGWSPILRPPLFAGLAALAACSVAIARRKPVPKPAPAAGTATRPAVWPQPAVGLLVASVLYAGFAFAQAPDAATVFVTPAAEPDRFDVLAPAAVLERLDRLARPASPVAGPTSAVYDVVATADSATVDAQFSLWCPTAGPHSIALPLADARLESASLDDRPAFPEAAGPGNYTVAVRGAGWHRLKVRFLVTVATVGGDREMRFGTPDLPASRVTVRVPSGAVSPDVASRRGAQRSIGGDPFAIEADHGPGKAVVVRWRAGSSGKSEGASVSVRQACVWDLRESDFSATAAFLYRVETGSVSRLKIELPAGLEPGRVAIRPTEPRSTPPGLRTWKIEHGPGDGRTLNLELQAPAVGTFAVVTKLYPTRAAVQKPTLRFAKPVGVTDADAFFALRLLGTAAEEIGRAAAIDYPADAFAKEFGAIPDLDLTKSPVARAFRLSTGGSPELRPVLRSATPSPTASLDVTWTVGTRAEAEGTLRLAAKDAPAAAIEFEVGDKVVVGEVRAADLAGWNQIGNRVQAWFRSPAKDATVKWTAVLDGYKRSGRPGSDANNLELPVPRTLPASADPIAVRVLPAPGWSTEVFPAMGLRIVPLTSEGSGSRVTVDANVPVVRIAGIPPDPPLEVTSVESLGRVGNNFAYRAQLAARFRPGRPHPFQVTLSGPTIRKPELRIDGASAGEPTSTDEGPTWSVFAPASSTNPLRLTLTAEVPVGSDDRLPQPLLSFGPTPVLPERRWIVLDPAVKPAERDPGWIPLSESDSQRAVAGLPAGVWASAWSVDPSAEPRVRLASLAAVPTPPTTTPESLPTKSFAAGPSNSRTGPPWLAAAVWLVGLLAVALLTIWGHQGWWPERIAGCGVLGLAAAGVASPIGWAFGALAIVGWTARVAWSIGRVARVAVR